MFFSVISVSFRGSRLFQKIKKTRRRPTLPGPCGPSTIGTRELNFCVRHGNRCGLSVIVTGFVSYWVVLWGSELRFQSSELRTRVFLTGHGVVTNHSLQHFFYILHIGFILQWFSVKVQCLSVVSVFPFEGCTFKTTQYLSLVCLKN